MLDMSYISASVGFSQSPPRTDTTMIESYMGPTALYAGSNSERQSVGLPGHCVKCAELGHVDAHPDLGCGDVGCHSTHGDEESAVMDTDPTESEVEAQVEVTDLTRPAEFFTVRVRDYKDTSVPATMHGLYTDRDAAERFAKHLNLAYPDFLDAEVSPIHVGTIAAVATAQHIEHIAPCTDETYAQIRAVIAATRT